MSYGELARLVTFRPLSTVGAFAPRWDRPRSQFSAKWSDTVVLLERELRLLRASRVVLELDMEEQDFRLDGLPRANARARTPGVILSMETPHGPLRYVVDTYASWEENVRAIAKALEALRAVDRYGVTKRGEQYAGWKALPSGNGGASAERGRALIRDYGSVAAALHATHPDKGGNAEEFEDVQAAREAAFRSQGRVK
jgi:hypothetical protein